MEEDGRGWTYIGHDLDTRHCHRGCVGNTGEADGTIGSDQTRQEVHAVDVL